MWSCALRSLITMRSRLRNSTWYLGRTKEVPESEATWMAFAASQGVQPVEQLAIPFPSLGLRGRPADEGG